MTPSRTQPAPGAPVRSPGAADSLEDGATDAPPIVLIGLGNDIACDDGVGIYTAHLLESEYRHRDDVEVVALPWAGFALLDVLRGRRCAVVVDSLLTGRYPPGTIVRLDIADLSGSVRLNSFHDISYPMVLDLGRSLGWEMPDDVSIFGIEIDVADEFGEILTPAVAEAAATVVREVKRSIDAMGTSIDERVVEL